MFKGFLVHSLQKSQPSDFKVIYDDENEDVYDPNHNNFILKLKIEKSFI